MYRAPATRTGAAGYVMLIVILWGVLYLAGCTDTPSDPDFDSIPPMEDVEIEMATDPDLTAALIEDVSSSMSANMTAAAAVEISTADSLFNEARVELTRGDYERVRSLGDRARDALGRALARGQDRSSLDDFIDRVRDVRRLLAAGDTVDFDRPSDLARDIDRLLDDADGRTRSRRRRDRRSTDHRCAPAHRPEPRQAS